MGAELLSLLSPPHQLRQRGVDGGSGHLLDNVLLDGPSDAERQKSCVNGACLASPWTKPCMLIPKT